MTETHEEILIIRRGETLDIVFNRPEKRNALTPQMWPKGRYSWHKTPASMAAHSEQTTASTSFH